VQSAASARTARQFRSGAMSLGSHQRTVGLSQNHITPRWIIDRLGGPFDLDPAAADPRPWPCARTNWTTHGLERPWPRECFVYLRPIATRSATGSRVLPSTATGSRYFTHVPKRVGLNQSGSVRPQSYSWPTAFTSIAPMERGSPQTLGHRRFSRRSAMKPSRGCIAVGSPVHSSHDGTISPRLSEAINAHA
jgi:hypothetical protein